MIGYGLATKLPLVAKTLEQPSSETDEDPEPITCEKTHYDCTSIHTRDGWKEDGRKSAQTTLTVEANFGTGSINCVKCFNSNNWTILS